MHIQSLGPVRHSPPACARPVVSPPRRPYGARPPSCARPSFWQKFSAGAALFRAGTVPVVFFLQVFVASDAKSAARCHLDGHGQLNISLSVPLFPALACSMPFPCRPEGGLVFFRHSREAGRPALYRARTFLSSGTGSDSVLPNVTAAPCTVYHRGGGLSIPPEKMMVPPRRRARPFPAGSACSDCHGPSKAFPAAGRVKSPSSSGRWDGPGEVGMCMAAAYADIASGPARKKS